MDRVVDFPSIAVVVVVVYFLGRRIIMNIGLIGGGISCLIAGLVEDDGEALNFKIPYK